MFISLKLLCLEAYTMVYSHGYVFLPPFQSVSSPSFSMYIYSFLLCTYIAFLGCVLFRTIEVWIMKVPDG